MKTYTLWIGIVIFIFSPLAANGQVVINELDAIQTRPVDPDQEEFIELYDGGAGNTDLSGMVMVFYDGDTDTSYNALDLTGYTTSNQGYFVVCGISANVSNCNLALSSADILQNGADAVALYRGSAGDFPNGTPVTSDNLLTAVVYGTGQPDDQELIDALLPPGQVQINENSEGNAGEHSSQICGLIYQPFPPTPGTENVCSRGFIIIQKQTIPDGSTDVFGFSADWSANFQLQDGDTNTSGVLRPGPYAVTEQTVPPGWDLTDIVCNDPNGNSTFNLQTQTASIELDEFETVTCTFTNTLRTPDSIIIAKQTLPAGPSWDLFEFEAECLTTPGPCPLPMSFSLAHGETSETTNLAAGTYLVSETFLPEGDFDWELIDIACEDPDNGTTVDVTAGTAQIDLDTGETIICSYVNRADAGVIIVEKRTDPVASAQSFDFSTNYPAPAQSTFLLTDGQSNHSGFIPVGTYQVDEINLPADWSLLNAACSDGSPPGAVVLEQGETVTCTFTNQQSYTLTVITSGTGTVSLDPAGGTYPNGTVVDLTPNPAPGWVFTGWSGDINGAVNPTSIQMNENKTVTATFAPLYTLAVNIAGSGTVTLDPPGNVYVDGSDVQLTATPSPGWVFSGWSGDHTGNATPATITMDGNKTVTATFVPLYTLTVNTVGSGTVGLVPSGGVYPGGTNVQLTANPSAGWVFSGWSDDLGGSANPASIAMDGDKTVTATFVRAQYTLTVNVVGSGSVGLSPPGGTYLSGTDVQLTADPAAGWVFSGWSGDLAGNQIPATIAMDGNKSVTATFVQEQYTLTVNIVGSGSVMFNPPQTGRYPSGMVVQLTAEASQDWAFDFWSGDLAGNANPVSITMDSDKTVTANFAPLPEYTLTVHTVGSGGVTLDPPGGTYLAGAVIELTADPAAGWTFDNWSEDLTGHASPAAITMDGNKAVTATFVQSAGFIIVEKHTRPAGYSQSFEFNPGYGANFFLMDGETRDSGPLAAGTYSVAEINIPENWHLSGAVCDDGSDPGAIVLDAGETITCRFTNQYDLPVPTLSINGMIFLSMLICVATLLFLNRRKQV